MPKEIKPLNERLPDWAIHHVREWLMEKETDDFGGEMTATEFKQELLEEIKP